MVQECLIHNLRECRIPEAYTMLIELMLSNRKTRLKFDDFLSDWFLVVNGTTQGCPLSMILYAIYNAPLIESTTPSNKDELAVGFVNNAMFLAIADMLENVHTILGNIMQQP